MLFVWRNWLIPQLGIKLFPHMLVEFDEEDRPTVTAQQNKI